MKPEDNKSLFYTLVDVLALLVSDTGKPEKENKARITSKYTKHTIEALADTILGQAYVNAKKRKLMLRRGRALARENENLRQLTFEDLDKIRQKLLDELKAELRGKTKQN